MLTAVRVKGVRTVLGEQVSRVAEQVGVEVEAEVEVDIGGAGTRQLRKWQQEQPKLFPYTTSYEP